MFLQRYKGASHDSGVVAYGLPADGGIVLEFRDGKRYLYNDSRPGREHVEQMKALAAKGEGLTTYVNQHVRSKYATLLR